MRTREDVAAFVASLAVPEDRREVVLAELLDHVESAARDGVNPAFGDLAELRVRLEGIEPAFRFGWAEAWARGALTSGLAVLVAFLTSKIPVPAAVPQLLMELVRGALILPIFALLAPRGLLALLRADMHAPRVRTTIGGIFAKPIGPAQGWFFLVIFLPWAFVSVLVFVVDPELIPQLVTPLLVACSAAYLTVLTAGVRERIRRRGISA